MSSRASRTALAWMAAVAVAIAAAVSGAIPTATPAAAATCTSSVGPGIPPPAKSPGGLPGFHAQWFGQSGYMTLCPGGRSVATVAYHNTGSQGWVQSRMGEAAYLGTWGPEPGADQPTPLGGVAVGWPSANRIAQQPSAYVGPGQIAWFQFTVQAPTSPGVYVMALRPVIEGAQWMEDYGVYLVLTVLNPDGSPPGWSQRPSCGGCWPLVGGAIGGGPVGRRALNVRIDNAPAARPHSGTSLADVVFETLVEAGITRYQAIFHSKDPPVIGSVRSARLVDRYITPMVRGALAYSGATDYETDLIRADAGAGRYIDLNANYSWSSSAYYRSNRDSAGNPRSSPYDMFTSSDALRRATNAAGGGGAVAIPNWEILDYPNHVSWAGGMYGSGFANTITIPYQHNNEVRYRYDAATATYARWQNDGGGTLAREIDAYGRRPIAARNVVVIQTDVWTTNIVEDSLGSLGLDMRLTGSGPASIFRDGRRQDGTWSRAANTDAFRFTSRYGEIVLLSPGQTWIHVVPLGWSIPSN